MSKGRRNKLVGQVAEHLVVAELGRRGGIATGFAGNVPTFDVIAADELCRTVPIQVKASSGDSWPSDARIFLNIEYDRKTKRQNYLGSGPGPPNPTTTGSGYRASPLSRIAGRSCSIALRAARPIRLSWRNEALSARGRLTTLAGDGHAMVARACLPSAFGARRITCTTTRPACLRGMALSPNSKFGSNNLHGDAMTAAELVAARKALGLTDIDLALELSVTPDVVRAWETGSSRIPRRRAEHIQWLVAAAERKAALRASGLPECEWIRAQNERPLPSNADAIHERIQAVKAHALTCPVCKARERYIEKHFGPMPAFPQPGWIRIFGWFERVPAWARPAVVGALVLGAIVSVRILFALPVLFSSPGVLGGALLAVGAAAGAGAFGGIAFSLTRPVLRKLGRPGDYLTGIVCVFAYMGALAVAAPNAFGEPLIHDSSEWVIFSIVSLFFGLVIGHSWFRQTTEGRGTEVDAGAA